MGRGTRDLGGTGAPPPGDLGGTRAPVGLCGWTQDSLQYTRCSPAAFIAAQLEGRFPSHWQELDLNLNSELRRRRHWHVSSFKFKLPVTVALAFTESSCPTQAQAARLTQAGRLALLRLGAARGPALLVAPTRTRKARRDTVTVALA